MRDKYKMKFGITFSWIETQSYGDSPRYNDLFSKQLTELLSNYGEISGCGSTVQEEKKLTEKYKNTIGMPL